MLIQSSHLASILPDGRGLSRLVNAAVVSQNFRNLLLNDPMKALKVGYDGASFRLAPEEQELVLSIRASSLADFAAQLAREIQSDAPVGLERVGRSLRSTSPSSCLSV